ncbi:MAG: patatin-like phospholipase family protein [Elusimicrobia bacterium]|nr:patatin-like phospholipase family protein [Elusimicrobiota bacterium]
MNPEESRSWEPFLKRVPLFSGLSSSDIRRVAGRMQLLSMPKGATLYVQGDESDALYLVTSGAVRIVNPQRGPDAVVAMMGRGDVLGEAGLLTGERRSVTVRLDTSCEFLKLKRQDFEALSRENPTFLIHLSRMLSTRLVTSGSKIQGVSPCGPQLVSLNVAGLPEDRLVLAVHLGLALLEQTRRRTLLVDMGEDAGGVARSVGLPALLVTEPMVRAVDLNAEDPVKGLVQQHPSGLDLLSLPAFVLGGRLYSGIYLFLNGLRDSYDIVLVSLGNDLGDVERSILSEADQGVLAGTPEGRQLYRQLDMQLSGLIQDRGRIIETWLGAPDPEMDVFSSGARRMFIPWSGGVASRLRSLGSSCRAIEGEPRALGGVARLARMIGGVQVGLALGSGAALGYSLIGVLKVLKREHIPVDVVAGTSMGALLGGLTALGIEPEEIEEQALRIDKGWVYENFLWDLTVPRSGLFAGATLLRFLRSYFGNKEFHDLELPLACVATDIETGEEVVLRTGRVAEAIRASCGLPLIFAPIRLGGRYLVDGGLVSPVPTRVAAGMGADIVLAVNLTMPAGARRGGILGRRREAREGILSLPLDLSTLRELTLPEALRAPNVFEVFFQMIYTMEYGIARARTDPAHLVIQPDFAGFHWTEMHRAAEIIAMGERAAEECLPRIKALLPFFADSCKVPLRTPKRW